MADKYLGPKQPEENMSEKHIVIVGAGLVSVHAVFFTYIFMLVFLRRLGGEQITLDPLYIF